MDTLSCSRWVSSKNLSNILLLITVLSRKFGGNFMVEDRILEQGGCKKTSEDFKK